VPRVGLDGCLSTGQCEGIYINTQTMLAMKNLREPGSVVCWNCLGYYSEVKQGKRVYPCVIAGW